MAGTRWDQDLSRAGGMISGAGAIDQYAQNPFNMFQAGQQMRQPYQMGANAMFYGLNQGALQAPLQGTIARGGYQTQAADIIAGANVNNAAQRNAANQGMIGGFTNFMSEMPWGSMFGGGSQFGNWRNPMYTGRSGGEE